MADLSNERNRCGFWKKGSLSMLGAMFISAPYAAHHFDSPQRSVDSAALPDRAYSLQELDKRLNGEETSNSTRSVPETKDQLAFAEQTVNGAIDEWTRAIANDRKNANAYLERGWAFNSIREYKSALADITKAIALEPRSSDAWGKRAWIHATVGEYRKAIEDATAAIRIDPTNTEAYEARACAYANLGESEKAACDSAMSTNILIK